MSFSVEHPQLERPPGKSPAGLRRFAVYKNEPSDALLIGERPLLQKPSAPSVAPPARIRFASPENTLLRLQQELWLKQREFERLEQFKKLQTEVPPQPVLKGRFVPTDRNYNPYLDQAKHCPVFQQQKYTRCFPKFGRTNPIIGFN